MLKEGLYKWKLRLILSALLSILGLAGMISMILGIFLELTIHDKTIVAIAIFMVGIPAYLIASGLARIDELTIAAFLNENIEELNGDAELLARDKRALTENELQRRSDIEAFFEKTPVYKHLPDKPVKQAYYLLLLSMIISFGIWYFV